MPPIALKVAKDRLHISGNEIWGDEFLKKKRHPIFKNVRAGDLFAGLKRKFLTEIAGFAVYGNRFLRFLNLHAIGLFITLFR